jgi:deoxycytidylate deaminase
MSKDSIQNDPEIQRLIENDQIEYHLKSHMKQCKKLTTVAIIMKDNQLISIGTNEIHAVIDVCPRKDMPTGVGYELCKSICHQEYHAEVDACIKAGDKANGGTLYLIGHTYCCDNCKKVMNEYGIKNVVIC